MKAILTLSVPMMMVSCAAFQKGATDAEAGAAGDAILAGGTLLAPLVGPFAPLLPLLAGLTVKIGKMIRNK